MRSVFLCLLLVGMATLGFAQKKQKLSKEEMSRMTPEQRLVHETQRKSNKHNRVSNKKKVRIQKQQSRKSERIKQPKRKKGKR